MDDTLDDLKKELFRLKTDFSRRIIDVEQKIHFLETHLENRSIPKAPPGRDNCQKTVQPPRPVLPDNQESIRKTDVSAPKRQTLVGTAPRVKKENQKTILASLLENLLPMFGPVTVLFVKFLEVYKHYQSQGKAPVFFMTLSGILTLVMGFGYLLQYSFSQFLGPVGKVLIGFGAALGITLCGILINRKRPDMADYASSLIGLGMILCYLCTYFTGTFYNIISDFGTFVVLAGITGIAYMLALTFKTRVVAVISLLGGTFAPLFMAWAIQSPLVYLAYVLIIVIAMLHLSMRINWPVLSQISMVVSFLVIEFVLTVLPARPALPLGLIIIVHLFFYLFCIHNGLEILKQSSITKAIIAFFSSNIFFYLFALNQLVPENELLGRLYLLNAFILTIIFFCIPKMIKSIKKASSLSQKPLQMICLLSVGLLAGFGILAQTGPEFLGLVWGVEALVLSYMGHRFNIIQVRMEAHVILMLSILLSAYHVTTWFATSIVPPPQLFQLNLGYGWMNLMVTWTLLWSYLRIMEKYRMDLVYYEKIGLKGCNEILSVCLSLSFLSTVGIFWVQGIWLLSIVPMFYLLYRSKTKQLEFTEYLGLLHFLLLIVPMMISADIVGSLFFSEQMVLGKIARIEAFFCLFLIAEFYGRYHEKSRLNFFAQILRQAFFCIIPVSFLPGVWHQSIYFFPVAVWLSACICLALFCWLKYQALLIELKCLVIGSSLISVAACVLVKFAGWQGHATLSLMTGLFFYTSVLFIWKGLKKDPIGPEAFQSIRNKLSLFFSFFFYYLGAFLFIIIFESFGSAPLALTLVGAYFYSLFVKLPLLDPLKNNEIILYGLVFLCAGCMIIGHFAFCFGGFYPTERINGVLFRYGIFSILSLVFYGLMVHQRAPHFETARDRLGGQLLQFWGCHCLASLTYIGAFSQWFSKGFGPALSVALVLHATLVLFLTLKPRFQRLISLAVVLFVVAAGKIIFWDMTDFSLIQKMIAFIIIGSLLLGAAYQYQKMKTVVLESESA